MNKAGVPTAPLILGTIVGNSMEVSFRQALVISDGSYGIFVGSPIAVTLMIVTIASIVFPFLRGFIKSKKTVEA